MKKHIPNIITFIRIPCSLFLLLAEPFSINFLFIYLICGISDVLDGFLARKLNIQSKLGSKMDSIADTVLVITMLYIFLTHVSVEPVIWWGIILISLIKLTSLIVGIIRFHRYSSVHTYLNKISGILLFLLPFTYTHINFYQSSLLLCIVCMCASLEELLIVCKSRQINTDCKSILKL